MWGDVSLLAQGWYTKKEEAQGEAQEDDVQKYQEAWDLLCNKCSEREGRIHISCKL